MEYIDKIVRNKGTEFGPYKMQQVTSVQDALEHWGEDGLISLANAQAVVKQAGIARDMAVKGANEDEINATLQAWKPGFTSIRAAEKRFAELLPQLGSNVEAMQNVIAVLNEQGIHAAVAKLESYLQ